MDEAMTRRSTDDKSFSLRRWSQRKAAARAAPRAEAERAETARGATSSAGAATVVAAPFEEPIIGAQVDASSAANRPDAPARVVVSASPAEPALPAIDSLSIESDFTGFMQPGVDESLKRGALKKLFSDPRFNVMDGLDVYIDDYSKPDPIDPAIVRTLSHARYIFNPPATRVTAEGYVEDIPDEEVSAVRAAEAEAAGGSDVAGQDAVVALPGVRTTDDAVPSVVQQQDDSVPSSIAQTHVDSVLSTAQSQDDEMPTKPQCGAA
jgi:Protein of unknown function (DUF3306)